MKWSLGDKAPGFAAEAAKCMRADDTLFFLLCFLRFVFQLSPCFLQALAGFLRNLVQLFTGAFRRLIELLAGALGRAFSIG